MILSFKKQFVTPIVKAQKKHTIREDNKDRWHKGKVIHCATGLRTRDYQEFARLWCTHTQKIEIRYLDGIPRVYVDGLKLTDIGMQTLAANDGFETIQDFFKWFKKDFTGKIIHWTNLKY